MYARPYGYAPYGYNRGLGVRGVLIITAVIIVLIIGIFVYARISAKKALAEELPSQYADEKYTTEESKKIRYLSTAIREDLSRMIQGGHALDIYKQLRNATDRVFEGVAVDYKRVAGETLRQSLADSQSSFSINLTEGFFGESMDVYNGIITRLNMLQIA